MSNRHAHLTPAQRARMKVLGEMVDIVSQDDRLFFEQNPGRRYRVRLSAPAEIEQIEIVGGGELFVPLPDTWALTIVKQVDPGCRVRTFTTGPRDFEMPDEIAGALFDALARGASIVVTPAIGKAPQFDEKHFSRSN